MNNDNVNDPEYWINMAFSLTKQGKDDLAKKYYQKVIELDPDNVAALINWAKAAKPPEFQQAKAYLSHALEIDKNSVEALINLGVIYDDEGNRDEALKCYTNALELDPSRPEIWHNRGLLYSFPTI